MLCLDKIKIITSINYIKDIKKGKNKFKSTYEDKELQYHKYQQKNPYSLTITIDYVHYELGIEFTSKILKDNFIHLINNNTIRECLNNINQLDICTLDIDKIINNSKIYKCDPVKDVDCQDIKALKNYTNTNLVNYNRWKQKPYRNGFSIENVVGTPRYKNRVVVYNKEEELQDAKKKPFLDSLSDKEKCLSHYKNKIRIELNINTASQVRQLLNIKDNQLMSVLNSEANPILTVLNKALKEPSANSCVIRTFKEYILELVLKDCDYDLGKVEAKIRSLYSKNTQISDVMKPYRELHHRLFNNTVPTFDIRKLVV